MTKQRSKPLSVKQRREEARRRKQAQQNRLIAIGGGLLAVAAVAFIIWQVVGSRQPAVEESVLMTGDRPLAALEPAARDGYYDQYPPMVIDTNRAYEAVITMAGGGEMRLHLFADEAPLTVNNFVYLANQGYYDGTIFHRVLENFMAQGGDPSGTGMGGPGYQFADETANGLTFDRRGLLAMANAGANTNGSQFFITFVPTPHLDGRHTIFGELIEGDEVLQTLTLRNPEAPNQPPGDVIQRIDIVESQ